MTLSTPIKFIYRPAHSKVHVEMVCSCGSGHPQQCRCSPQLKTYPRSGNEGDTLKAWADAMVLLYKGGRV